MVVFNDSSGYYHALDSTFSQEEIGDAPPVELDSGEQWTTSLSPTEIGMSANPMQSQVEALRAKIREGMSKVELEFPGAGKGSSQQPTPESYGTRERAEIREMSRAAGNIETSTHATFNRTGFSGLGERGFSDEARYQNIKEVKKAIQFAAEATTGGAVVFHTGEWQRPISETWGKGADSSMPDAQFQAYEEEEERAAHLIVDDRTGDFVSAIKKDKELFRPKFMTAADIDKMEREKAEKEGRRYRPIVGKYDRRKGKEIAPDDFVDMDHEWIDESDPNRAFEKIPQWDGEHTKFVTEIWDWKRIEQETAMWNQKHPQKQLTPAEMYIRVELENQILQSKGHSLFYANRYEDELWQEKKLKEALKFYQSLDKNLPEDEKYKLMTERGMNRYGGSWQYTTADSETIPDQIARELKQVRDQMRHVHEASSAADAQARDREEMLTHLKTVDEYGLKKSTEGIARAGMYAYEQTEKNKKELENPIYVAPENWQTQMYGGHPDELINLVQGARNDMAEQLMRQRGKSEAEAKKLAKQHIKSTIDIGHLNLWRQHFVGKQGESEDQRNKRFNQWAIKKTKDMIDAGIVGHIHIADNMGWDDEHLTPGEGNAPIKEFVAEMEKAGIKDFHS
jgi:sugar phosphate isomerase/epimerase